MYKTKLSETTISKRALIKACQDEFCTFSWRGLDAFDNFGAFIINDKKGSLKFYNGPGFSNKYTSPQFSANIGDLEGVQFNRQHITFKIAVYWITIQDYRKFLKWLDPLVVDQLVFGHNSKFGYNVKLAKISDSTKWIIGRENGEPTYYTELDLDFEIQGAQCAVGTHSYEFEWDVNNKSYVATWNKNSENDFVESDLPTPFEVINVFNIITEDEANLHQDLEYLIQLQAKYTYEETVEGKIKKVTNTIDLYSVQLKNLTVTLHEQNTNINEINPLKIGLVYHSETGMLFLQYADEAEKILTQQTTSDTGERIVSSFSSSKFYLPGQFNYPGFNTKNFELKLKVTLVNSSDNSVPNDFYENGYFICYPRTNII